MSDRRPVFQADADPDHANWLYVWGNLPTTLDGLRAWLKQQGIPPVEFKQSGRYQANADRFPWLKEL